MPQVRLLSVLAFAALAGCSSFENRLEGSISSSFSLEFDSVNVRKQDVSLIVEYIKQSGPTITKVAKMVLDTENLRGLGKDSKIDGQLFKDRVVVQREAPSGGDFPEVQSGELEFGDFEFEAGGNVNGSFNVGFVNGRTLYGEFTGTVEEVALD